MGTCLGRDQCLEDFKQLNSAGEHIDRDSNPLQMNLGVPRHLWDELPDLRTTELSASHRARVRGAVGDASRL